VVLALAVQVVQPMVKMQPLKEVAVAEEQVARQIVLAVLVAAELLFLDIQILNPLYQAQLDHHKLQLLADTEFIDTLEAGVQHHNGTFCKIR
jgi:hypothetical protein